MILVMNSQEAFMRQNLPNKHLQQPLHLRRKQPVDVQLLLRWVLNVTVRCKVLVYVMQHAVAMQIFVKNTQVQ
jgi:hypothetical protein